jgi:hypothetical protein
MIMHDAPIIGEIAMTTVLDLQPDVTENVAPTASEGDTPINSPALKQTEKESVAKKDTLVLDGPLSTIYTQALQIAYSKRPIGEPDGVSESVEKMAIDASMMGMMEVVDTTATSKKPLYIYVTDDTHLKEGDTAGTFDRLRVTSESGRYSGVWFCTEDGYRLSKEQILLSDYVAGVGGKVYYSKESLWRALGV